MTAILPVAAQRPALSRRDQVLGVIFGCWTIIGLFLDGWAHDNNKPESFFTPWHGILYSGFVAASLAAVLVVWRPRRTISEALARLPRGHGLTISALGIFGIAALGDLVWHEVLGVEVGLEALLSPTHLALLAAGLVALSAPIRTAWTEERLTHSSLRAMLPMVVCFALLTALVGFFLLYVSPFINDTVGVRFDRVAGAPHDHPSVNVDELQQILGVVSILFTSVLLAAPINLMLRRWPRPPVGTFTVYMFIVVLLFVGLGEFSQPWILIAGIASGIVLDSTVRTRPPWLSTAAALAVLWTVYFVLYRLTGNVVAWSAELSAGTVVLSALLGGAVGLINADSGAPVDRLQ